MSARTFSLVWIPVMRERGGDGDLYTWDGNPETHAANPPETWKVERVKFSASRPPLWYVTTADGGRLSSAHATRKSAELERTEGFYVNLWHDEARWYAGYTPPGHRSWAECKAERDRIAERNRNRTLADTGSA